MLPTTKNQKRAFYNPCSFLDTLYMTNLRYLFFFFFAFQGNWTIVTLWLASLAKSEDKWKQHCQKLFHICAFAESESIIAINRISKSTLISFIILSFYWIIIIFVVTIASIIFTYPKNGHFCINWKLLINITTGMSLYPLASCLPYFKRYHFK